MRGRQVEESPAALAGQTELAKHQFFPGNRPSNLILLPRLDAFHLGALLALYEHKVFIQSIIWQLNPFDQWGVELGKVLAKPILGSLLVGGSTSNLDSSTAGLIELLRSNNLQPVK
jgi:glucose-6-phosphate isomerase